MGQARDYEALLRELLAGVAGGWSYGNVTDWLICKDLKDRDLAQWLRENGAALWIDIEVREQLGNLASLEWGELTEAAKMVKEWEEWEDFDSVEDDWSGFEEEWLSEEEHEKCFNQGNNLYDLGEYEKAIVNFDKAIEIKPDYHNAWRGRGISFSALGQDKEAISIYERAIEIKSDFHEAWNSKGIALIRLGRYKEAIVQNRSL